MTALEESYMKPLAMRRGAVECLRETYQRRIGAAERRYSISPEQEASRSTG